MSKKSRVLIAGDVEGRFEATFKRVAALNSSANGPFDFLICVGRFFAREGGGGDADASAPPPAAPIPTYFFEAGGASGPLTAEQEVAPQVTYLGRAGITSLKGRLCGLMLTVAFISDAPTPEELAALTAAANAPGFLGADVLVSSDWARGTEVGLSEATYAEMASLGVHLAAVGADSVAEVAAACKPRYHFAGARDVFFQRAPYRNHAYAPAQRRSHITRFLGLGRAAASKDKARKWLHAVEIEPIPYMDRAALVAEPPGCTDCPYLAFSDAAAPGGGGDDARKRARQGGGGDAPMGAGMVSSIEAQERVRGGADGIAWQAQGAPPGGTFFFAEQPQQQQHGGRKRGRQDRGGGGDAAPSPDNKTLYVGGLPAGTDAAALRALVCSAHPAIEPTLRDVRVPPGKQFAFVDFGEHEAAFKALATLHERGAAMALGGARLSFSWGKAPPPSAAGGGGVRPPGGGGVPMDARTSCWFCLASPECQAHLVLSVAEEVYVALPKVRATAEPHWIDPRDPGSRTKSSFRVSSYFSSKRKQPQLDALV